MTFKRLRWAQEEVRLRKEAIFHVVCQELRENEVKPMCELSAGGYLAELLTLSSSLQGQMSK